MIEPLLFLLSGAVLGLAAGISPGPLLTLVVSETLRQNRKAGMVIAIAPILTDIPIVTASVLVLTKLSGANVVLGTIAMVGALFMGYLAYENITAKGIEISVRQAKEASLRKGIIANVLSPYPYLFWMTVGAPTVLKAFGESFLSAFLFLGGFYLLLIGSKIFVALLVDKSRAFLRGAVYVAAIKALGFILLLLAALFIKDGLQLFGLLQQ
jgi:threonine/homoserine/homoserine lactone efflux protein